MAETEHLAEFIAHTETVPDDVVHEAKRCLIDWTGVGLAGAVAPLARPIHDAVPLLGARAGCSPLFGTQTRTTPLISALANGTFSHIHDYDDTYSPPETAIHGSTVVWPAIFALGGRGGDKPLSGSAALLCFVVGYEVASRVAVAAGRSHYERGWHVTGTAGPVGASAAVARGLSYSPDVVVAALGTAATQASGIKEVYGSLGKPFHAGKAAMSGYLAGTLAGFGLTSSPTALEGKLGMLSVLSDGGDPGALTRGLGYEWALRSNAFKPFACGKLMHPAIEAAIALRTRYKILPEDVVAVKAAVHPYVLFSTGKRNPQTGLDARFSIYYAVTIALLDGMASVAQFEDARLQDPYIRQVIRRVEVIEDDRLDRNSAVVDVTLSDGRLVSSKVDAAKGTPESPLSDAEVEAKFLGLTTSILGEPYAKKYLEGCWNVESLEQVGDLQDYWYTRMSN